MHFSRFRGGPNGPNPAKQALIMFGIFTIIKIGTRPPGHPQIIHNPKKYVTFI